MWKRVFIYKSQGEDENERPLIVAHEDNTEVFLNGATSANRILNAGEYWSISGTEYSSFAEGSHMFVKTSKVFAYQAIGSIGNSGNPSSANVELFLCLQLMMIHHVLLITYQMEVEIGLNSIIIAVELLL